MFLKGSITLVENNNVYNRINFTGQEFIRLHFAGMQGMSQEQEDEMAIIIYFVLLRLIPMSEIHN